MQVKVCQIIAPLCANGDAQPALYQLLESRRALGVVYVVQAVRLGDGVGQDVHPIGLIVEHLARLLARLHVPRRIADELSKSDAAVFGKDIAALFGPLALWHIHCLWVIVNDLGISGRDRSLVDDDAQDARKDRLGSRSQP